MKGYMRQQESFTIEGKNMKVKARRVKEETSSESLDFLKKVYNDWENISKNNRRRGFRICT